MRKKNFPKRAGALNPRQQVIAAWRGVDLTPLEKARAFSAKPVGHIMPHVLTGLKLDRRQADLEVLKVWNNLIDPSIVAHARPTGLNKGTLFVTVDNSVWLHEIVRYRRKEILERLQHSFGRDLIVRISFRVG
ncbi:MAG: DUF721 domain-containing protein [Verrucomicrobiota bacterium]